jgi:hypothetical protein
MNFDEILDKTWIDFQNEIRKIQTENVTLQSMKIFTILTHEVQMEINDNKNVVGLIEQAYAFDKIEPSLKLLDNLGIELNDWVRQYKSIQKTLNQIQFAHSAELWSMKDQCATDYTMILYVLSILMVMKRFHNKCEISDFLFCIVAIEKQNVDIHNETASDLLFKQLQTSRMNYILNKKYFPIVCMIVGDAHATTILILPKVQGHQVTWHTVHINSNGSYQYSHRQQFSQKSFEKYKNWVSKQKENTYIQKTSFCVNDIQKNFNSCGHWSLFITFQLLRDYNDHIIEQFCENVAKGTDNPMVIGQFNQYIGEMRLAYESLIVHTVETLKKQEEKSQFPTIAEFCSHLIHGPDHQIYQLDVAIMKSLNHLRNYMKQNPEVEERDDSEQYIQRERKTNQIRNWESNYKKQSEIMQQLCKNMSENINEDRVKSVKLQDIVNIKNDLGKFIVMFHDKKEFREWIQYWFTLNKYHRNELFNQQDIDKEVKKFAEYMKTLLQRLIKYLSKQQNYQ